MSSASSEAERRLLTSRPRLLREPDDRKERMGGMTARGEGPSFRGARKDTGGLEVDLRLSWAAASSDLGRSSSRWPRAQSLVVVVVVVAVSAEGEATVLLPA